MRNYSAISDANFESYTINGGEYVQDVSIVEILVSLSSAFGIPQSTVMSAWDEVIFGAPFSEGFITPSEFEVLIKLYEFLLFVSRSLDSDGKDTKSKVFVYANLNTGKTVTWIHTVC